MTQAITTYKAWAVAGDKAVSPEFVQYLELSGTGANTDTAQDYGTAAGTLWTAALADVTYGTIAAAAKKILYELGEKADFFLGVFGDLVKSRARLASASGDHFAMAAGTATGTVDLTFNSGNAPTSWKIVFGWKMGAGVQPVNISS